MSGRQVRGFPRHRISPGNDHGGLPIEQISQTGTPLHYGHDQLGSTTALTNQTGTTAAGYTYDAYGNPTSPAPAGLTNPFGYTGQYSDPETGLHTVPQ